MGEAFSPHDPVLLTEVLDALAPRPMPGRAVEPKKSATFSDRALADARVVDGTFGAGGYSRALLGAGARVVGIDRDPSVAPFVAALSEDYPQRFRFVAGRFAELDELAGDGPVDGVVLDIGVSSMQLDQSERGFSFMRAGPLDMRMSMEGESAADLVNTLDETALANLIFAYGEERASRRIAKAIVSVRADAPITDTKALADLIEKTIGRRPGGPHPATRTFQALRIAVNREFDELVEGLFAAERLLGEGGRLAVVTFHSLEDRIVKRFFDSEKAAGTQSRHMPMAQKSEARWAPVRKPIKAGEAELAENPRARSATLRSAVRTGAAARAVSVAGLGVPGFRGAAR